MLSTAHSRARIAIRDNHFERREAHRRQSLFCKEVRSSVNEPTLFLALLAGTASFVSPCMLPVIPAFLAQLAGTSLGYTELKRRDLLFGTVLFVAGFSIVFAVLGVVLNAALQNAATEVLAWLSRVAGVVVILLGLHLTGLLRLAFLDRRFSVRPSANGPGHLAPLLFGASFAVAWDAVRRADTGEHPGTCRRPAGLRFPAAARLRSRPRDAVSARRPSSPPGRSALSRSTGGPPRACTPLSA